MKKVFTISLIMIMSIGLISCSSGDDDPVSGCTDPNSINYNSNATENDNSCQYSIVGDWRLTKYTAGSTNVLSGYSSLNMNISSNGTTRLQGTLNSGVTIIVNGTYVISGLNNSTITLSNTDPGTEDYPNTVWTFNSITGTTFSISSDDVLGLAATIEGIKI